MTQPEPKTLAERLDDAITGEEFLGVLTDLFAALDCQIAQVDRELDEQEQP